MPSKLASSSLKGKAIKVKKFDCSLPVGLYDFNIWGLFHCVCVGTRRYVRMVIMAVLHLEKMGIFAENFYVCFSFLISVK